MRLFEIMTEYGPISVPGPVRLVGRDYVHGPYYSPVGWVLNQVMGMPPSQLVSGRGVDLNIELLCATLEWPRDRLMGATRAVRNMGLEQAARTFEGWLRDQGFREVSRLGGREWEGWEG